MLRGTGGKARHDIPKLSWAEPLRLADVETRFRAETGARLRPRSQDQYWNTFLAFARDVHLEQFSLKQLQGKKGRELILSHVPKVKPHSRRHALAAIKKVWRKALAIQWPIENDDLERFPDPRPIRAPKRDIVELWVHAADSEQDLYEKSWFWTEQTDGLRPADQQAELCRKHLVRNAMGKIVGILAEDPQEMGLKRDAPIEAGMPPELADVLDAWLAKHPSGDENAPIWPWRATGDGRIIPSRKPTPDGIERMRRKFAKRWHLPWVTSKAMRHFVITTLEDAGMPKTLRHLWRGHKAESGDMDAQYGQRAQPEDTFMAQLRYLPSGPRGTFLKVERTQEGVPKEWTELYLKIASGQVDRFDAMDKVKTLLQAMERQVTVERIGP